MVDISNILQQDVQRARERREESVHEIGKGTFPYQLSINLHGLITYAPKFKSKGQNPKAYNPLERLKKEPFQPTTVARDSEGYRVFVEKKNDTVLTGRKLAQQHRAKYDRKNKISVNGTWLKAPAINKIKNSILHKYYASGGDYSNDLKFFTYTIQAKKYFEKKREFLEVQKLINQERERDFRTEYRPFVPPTILNKLEKENQNPDQFFIKTFSDYLENTTKRKKQRIDSYVWVAEKTEQGVIHFHAIFDCKYLSAKSESSAWATRCGMEDFKNSVQYGIDRRGGQIKGEYTNLNPEGISAYLTKYVSKNTSLIYGRNYGMSRDFYRASVKGVQRFVNPTFFMQNKETGAGYFIFKSPWGTVDYQTGEIEYKNIHLPVRLLKTREIDIPSGKVPIYVLVCHDKAKLLKTIFTSLYSRSGHLFKDKKQLDFVYC